MVRTTVSLKDLGQRVDEMVERVEHGEMAVIESAGRERAVLVDATDYRLLRALAAAAAANDPCSEEVSCTDVAAIRAFLTERVSLSKAAELLNLSRFELQDRFHRLGVPLRLGPASLEEAQAEIAAALRH